MLLLSLTHPVSPQQNPPPVTDAPPQILLEPIRSYHHRTKHHLHRYAAGPGYLDWATQPDPFRRYEGAPQVPLPLPAEPEPSEPPAWDALFTHPPAPCPLDLAWVSRFLYDSVALSAWKAAGSSRWSLRVNPSSGDLHPTETYLVLPPLAGLSERPAVWHYEVYGHALERRLILPPAVWEALEPARPADGFWVGLTSIAWREAWKYGERAWRYCQLDAGHAWAALALSARVAGWRTARVHGLGEAGLARLLGVHRQQGPEAERPELLLAVSPQLGEAPRLPLADSVVTLLEQAPWEGEPNRLSAAHRAWPVLDTVAEAAADPGTLQVEALEACLGPSRRWPWPTRPVGARHLIRRRRSAVAMDGRSHLARQDFLRILARLVPAHDPLLAEAPGWPPQVALLLFVHRISGLAPGLYALPRSEKLEAALPAALRSDYAWAPVDTPAEGAHLFRLETGDAREVARILACHQDIAADGAFAVAMLADFQSLEDHGPAWYPRLYQECGILGQLLYLEAEAAGLRGTGIGCFFDDALHQLVGLAPHGRWQDLYHFTVGGAVEDPRIRTLPAYAHRLEDLP